MWDQYRWLIIAILAVVLAQAALIAWLFFERRRRRIAEMELRRRLLEVIHLNRSATTVALSATIAHELNQPLGAILNNIETAELLLEADTFNRDLMKAIVSDIRRDDERAGDIIRHVRQLLKKRTEVELEVVDLNDALRDALDILKPEASRNGVVLSCNQKGFPLSVRADQIHLQQVILNLASNGMDARNAVARHLQHIVTAYCTRGERPRCCRAAEKRDELAQPPAMCVASNIREGLRC